MMLMACVSVKSWAPSVHIAGSDGADSPTGYTTVTMYSSFALPSGSEYWVADMGVSFYFSHFG